MLFTGVKLHSFCLQEYSYRCTVYKCTVIVFYVYRCTFTYSSAVYWCKVTIVLFTVIRLYMYYLLVNMFSCTNYRCTGAGPRGERSKVIPTDHGEVRYEKKLVNMTYDTAR